MGRSPGMAGQVLEFGLGSGALCWKFSVMWNAVRYWMNLCENRLVGILSVCVKTHLRLAFPK